LRNILSRDLCGCFGNNGSNGSAFLGRCFDNWLFGDRSSRSVHDLRCGLGSGVSRGLLSDRGLLGLGVFWLLITTNTFVIGTTTHTVGLCIFN
jgi:hypothetical protein